MGQYPFRFYQTKKNQKLLEVGVFVVLLQEIFVKF